MLRKLTVGLGRAARATGQAVDRLGMKVLGAKADDRFARHRQVVSLRSKEPRIAQDAWVAPNATVVGDVALGSKTSVFYGVVIRGDANPVVIDDGTNVQDGTIIHTAATTKPGVAPGAQIGKDVTIGHGCTLYSCTIENNVLVGMGSIVLDGARIDAHTILAAGSVVLPGTHIPSRQLWAGNPAKFVRDLTDAQVQSIVKQAADYRAIAQTHHDEFLPFGPMYLDSERIQMGAEKK